MQTKYANQQQPGQIKHTTYIAYIKQVQELFTARALATSVKDTSPLSTRCGAIRCPWTKIEWFPFPMASRASL